MAFTVKSILPTHTEKADFNGDGFTDLIWKGADGSLVIWNFDASGVYGVGSTFIPNPDPAGNTLTLRGYGDVTNDGTTDMVWQNLAGRLQTWAFHDDQVSTISDLTNYGMHYQIRGTGDFNGDGKTDLVWFVPPAPIAGAADGVWVTGSAENRGVPVQGLGTIAPFSIDFQFVGVGDFDGDGRDGILLRGTGNATVGTMMIQEPVTVAPRDGQMPTRPITFHDPGASWSVLGIADFNGDGKSDIAWQHSNAAGATDARSITLMDGGTTIGGGMLYDPGPDWAVVGSGDYNNDGKADLMLHHTSGWYAEWLMDGSNIKAFGAGVYSSGDFWTLGSV